MTHAARLTFVLALVCPTIASADRKSDAQKHIEAAMAAHGEGKFDVALTELQAAYQLDPDPELLYAIGQVHTKLGNCADASSYYRRYQETNKDPAVKSVIEQAEAGCQPPAPSTPPPAATTTAAPGAAPPSTTAPATPRSWKTDKLGHVLVGSGVALAVVGGIVYASAHGKLDDAEAAPDLATYDELVDSARSRRTLSVVLVGGGAALIGAGITHYVLHGRASTETRAITVAPTGGGGLVTWAGSF